MSHKDWFQTLTQNKSTVLSIICFPYAGGGAAIYSDWAKLLPDQIELIAVQPPGRANRLFEPSYSNMNNLVGDLLGHIQTKIDRPYIFFGHSLGSKIAFELLVKFQEKGIRLPEHFVISGCSPPHLPANKNPIFTYSDNEFIAELSKLNGTPDEILQNKELISLYLPLLRNEFKLAYEYYYKGACTINCPVSVFGGEDDKDIPEADLKSWGDFFSDLRNIHIFPGGHFFINTHRTLVLEKVNNIIAEILPKTVSNP